MSCSYTNDAVNLVKSAIFSVILKPFVVSFTYKLQSDTKENLLSIKDYFPYKLQGLVRGILIVGTLEEKKNPLILIHCIQNSAERVHLRLWRHL